MALIHSSEVTLPVAAINEMIKSQQRKEQVELDGTHLVSATNSWSLLIRLLKMNLERLLSRPPPQYMDAERTGHTYTYGFGISSVSLSTLEVMTSGLSGY